MIAQPKFQHLTCIKMNCDIPKLRSMLHSLTISEEIPDAVQINGHGRPYEQCLRPFKRRKNSVHLVSTILLNAIHDKLDIFSADGTCSFHSGA